MPRLILLVPVVVTLCACSQSRETYQQVRYVPTSTNEVYGTVAQTTWSGSRQAYELPTTSPAIDGEPLKRIDCERPGPQFGPTAMVAWGTDPGMTAGTADAQPMVGISMGRPAGDDTVFGGQQVVAMDGRPATAGLGLGIANPSVGGPNLRPRSTTGVGTDVNPVGRGVGLNDRGNPYCDHDDTYGTLSVDTWSPNSK